MALGFMAFNHVKRGDDRGSQEMPNGFRAVAGFGGVRYNGVVEGTAGSDDEHGGHQAYRDYALWNQR
jgi:hypothetical protein